MSKFQNKRKRLTRKQIREDLENNQKLNINMNCLGFFIMALTLLFVGLKLTKYINWNWLWILSPVWMSLSLLTILIIIALVIKWVHKLRTKQTSKDKLRKV